MNADRIQIQEGPSQVFQNRKGESTQLMEDNRVFYRHFTLSIFSIHGALTSLKFQGSESNKMSKG